MDQLQGGHVRSAVEGEGLKDGAGSLALRDIYEPGQAVEFCEEETIQTGGPPPTHTSIVLTFSLRAWSHLGAKQSKLFLVPHIQQWHSSFHRREHLVEEAAMIRNEGQGVRSLPFSLALPQPLHSMVAYPRRVTIPLQCGMGGGGGRENWGSPTHQLLTRDRQSKQKRQDPEQCHSGLKTQTAEETPEDQPCLSGSPRCQVRVA